MVPSAVNSHCLPFWLKSMTRSWFKRRIFLVVFSAMDMAAYAKHDARREALAVWTGGQWKWMRRRQGRLLPALYPVPLLEDPNLDDLLLDPPVDTNTLGPTEKPEDRTAASSAVSAAGELTTQDLRRASLAWTSGSTSRTMPTVGPPQRNYGLEAVVGCHRGQRGMAAVHGRAVDPPCSSQGEQDAPGHAEVCVGVQSQAGANHPERRDSCTLALCRAC